MELNQEIKDWFIKKYKLTELQEKFFKYFKNKENTLVIAPTGFGKTFTTFIAIINYIYELKLHNKKTLIIYISPLKALLYDVEQNINALKKDLFNSLNKVDNITVFCKTGDIKKNILSVNPDIILTTPESLNILLANNLEFLKFAEYIVVDEIHSLYESKRGVDLSLALSRLYYFNEKICKIGLSATVNPPLEVANFLTNFEFCNIIDIKAYKEKHLHCFLPVEDYYSNINSSELFYQSIKNIIDKYNTTLIFTNTRAGAERIALNIPGCLVHHSSLSYNQRKNTEMLLKEGVAKAVASSTSLELGLDIGSIDTVIQISSPKSINRCLQRVGRSGHKPWQIVQGYFICLEPHDLFEVCVMLDCVKNGYMDKLKPKLNCIDVLIQHILAFAIHNFSISELWNILKKNYCYKNLEEDDYLKCITHLNEKNKIFITEDRKIKLTFNNKLFYLKNLGTIREDLKIKVKLINGIEIGYIESLYLQKLNIGDVFSLSGKKYKLLKIHNTNITVEESSNLPDIPIWFSEALTLNYELACIIDNYRKNIIKKGLSTFFELFKEIQHLPVNKQGLQQLFKFFVNQITWLKNRKVNTIDKILVELTNDKIIFHTLYGKKVNEGLCRIFSALLLENKVSSKYLVSDVGFCIITTQISTFSYEIPINYLDLLKKYIRQGDLFIKRFRNILKTSLVITQENLPKYKQFIITRGILNLVDTNSILIKETYREILNDSLDLDNLNIVCKNWSTNNLEIVKTDTISPFAEAILLSDSDYFEGDKKQFLLEHDKLLKLETQSIFYKYTDKIWFFEDGLILNLENKKIMVITDLHLGLDLVIEKYGIKMPNYFEYMLVKFKNYVNLINPSEIIILGDLKEGLFDNNEQIKQIQSFINSIEKSIKITLIKGNHDAYLQKYLSLVDKIEIDEFCLIHGNKKIKTNAKYIIMGHVHASIVLSNKINIKQKFKCIWHLKGKEKEIFVLPAMTIAKFGTGADFKTFYDFEEKTAFLYEDYSWFNFKLSK